MKGASPSEPLEGTVQQLQDTINAPNAVLITTSKTWTNPRKRPHHDPTSLYEPTSNDDVLREANDGKELHASKRSRAAEWPLKNTDETAGIRKHDEPHDKRSSSTSLRPGKFLEGSMNDKVSQRPPSLYTRDEQAMEEYANLHGNGQDEMDMDVDMTYDAGIEPHKPSGMFRFGKAIANAFKPFTTWQGMFKEKEKETSTSPGKDILQERQAKAIEAYAELKKSGYMGTQAYRGTGEIPAIKDEDIGKLKAPFRDSGIDMDGDPSASEWTPNDQLIGSTEALLVPPPTQSRPASQISDASSARKSSLHLRKPSLQGLKKVASQINLSPVKKSSEMPPMPTIKVGHASEPSLLSPAAGLGLRREPSKRDMAKQYRLSKKVSDLENKLETARRELKLSVSNAPPVPDLPCHVGRKPFKPGALPSLPSERNMTPLEDNSVPPIPKTEGEQLGEILQGLPPKRSSARVTQQTNTFTSMTNNEDVRELEAGKSNQEIPRPRTSRGIKAQTPTGVHKRLPRVPSKTLHSSPLTYAENVPPIPTTAKTFAPSSHSQSAPAASKMTDHVSVVHTDSSPPSFLGRPAVASPMRTGSKKSKSKQGISPPPPSLASAKKANVAPEDVTTPKEGVESPVSAIAKVDPQESKAPIKTKRGISPPPPSLASAKTLTILSGEAATPTGILNDEIAPLQSISPQELNGDPIKKPVPMNGQPLPDSHKEDFEWDDDVF